MSVVVSGRLSDRPALRWGVCFAVIVAVHAAILWVVLQLRAPAPVPPPAAPAVLFALPPLPPARPAPPKAVAPAPQHAVARQPPAQPVVRPIVPKAPAPHPDVALPPRSKLPTHVQTQPQAVAPQPVQPVADDPPPAAAPIVQQQAEAPPVPAVVSAAPPVAAAPPSNAVPVWQGQLLARLERFKRYPSAAQAQRLQGVTYLRFTMDRRGTVLSASIERGSGFDLLDRETLALIHRAEPLPAPPAAMPGDPVELVVPVQFFLKPGF